MTFALFPSKNLVKAQKAYRLLNDLKIVLPILTLVLPGLGVFIARCPQRALIGAGLGFAASMLVLGAALLIARSVYMNGVPAGVLPADAAAAAFDILVRFIKTALRTLLVAGLIVAAGALFTGPSGPAVRTRSALSSGLGRIRHGGESGPASRWTYAHRTALRIGAVALAAHVAAARCPARMRDPHVSNTGWLTGSFWSVISSMPGLPPPGAPGC